MQVVSRGDVDLLLDVLSESHRLLPQLRDQEGRVPALQFCTCTNNVDPLNMRRIKVTTEARSDELVETDWLWRVALLPGYDPPLPAVGSSVIVGFLNGDPHDGVYFGPIHNQTNLPIEQETPTLDSAQEVTGHSTSRTDRNYTLSVGQAITFQTDAGVSITVTEAGIVKISGAGQVQVQAEQINLVCNKLTRNSIDVALLGAIDSSGDTLERNPI